MASLLRAAATAPRRVTSSVVRREFSALLSPLEEFPGIPTTLPESASASTASVTTLPNGLTVVSETGASSSNIALTFPNAGSSCESATESGAALANKFMSFKSGSGLSSAVILRNLENDGATPYTTASRTGATVGFTASKDKVIRLLPLLATTCTFEKWDVRDAQKSVKFDCDEASTSAPTVLTESIYTAAYGAQSPMGKTYYSSSATGTAIQSFRERTYVLNGAVLAATGIDDHESFVEAVETGFSESSVGTASTSPSIGEFVGGETRIHAPSTGFTHLSLAFEGPKSSALGSVIKQCIDLSSEGLSGFGGSGLLGVYSGCKPSDATSVMDALVSSITTMPSSEIFEKAKALAKAEAMFALEGGSTTLVNAMTTSVLEVGSFSSSDVAAAYDSITFETVTSTFEKMASSNPALAAVGDLSNAPYQGTIAVKFG